MTAFDISDTLAPNSDPLNAEVWRSVPGYEGAYEVSSLGRVRALDRTTDRGRKWRGQMMTLCPLRNDYLIVTLWRDGKQKSPFVHRLVLSAFVGPAPEGTEALHADSDRQNNCLSNLSWGTHSQNQYEQVENGTHVHASKTSCPLGHPYDGSNTYIYPGRPHRACRVCRREYQRSYREARRTTLLQEAAA